MMRHEVTGIPRQQRRFKMLGRRTKLGSSLLIRKQGRALRDDIRKRAPKDTGAYARSIRSEVKRGVTGSTIAVFTEHPAAHRLEYGFVGADSLGRVYAQEPRPHWRPAIAAAEKRLPKTFRKMVRDSVRKES